MKVLLVASAGGHLAQLALMRDLWEKHERHWVTFDKADAHSTVDGEHVTWAHHPTTRNLPNLARNTRLAWRLMRSYRPDLVLSTGAGVALPFFAIASLLGIRTVYVEVLDRVEHPTLTGALCYPLTDLFALQWPEQRRSYPDGKVIGWLT
jgi:beta-1,4-N-acetylglucosaminyltransferase